MEALDVGRSVVLEEVLGGNLEQLLLQLEALLVSVFGILSTLGSLLSALTVVVYEASLFCGGDCPTANFMNEAMRASWASVCSLLSFDRMVAVSLSVWKYAEAVGVLVERVDFSTVEAVARQSLRVGTMGSLVGLLSLLWHRPELTALERPLVLEVIKRHSADHRTPPYDHLPLSLMVRSLRPEVISSVALDAPREFLDCVPDLRDEDANYLLRLVGGRLPEEFQPTVQHYKQLLGIDNGSDVEEDDLFGDVELVTMPVDSDHFPMSEPVDVLGQSRGGAPLLDPRNLGKRKCR